MITGQGIDRVDGRLKVTGRATYAAEFALPRMAHAALVMSTIAKGRITGFDDAAAKAAPGVLAILTPMNAPRLPQGGKAAVSPPTGRVLALLQDDQVSYNNQPIAIVVAETHEQAMEAARLLRPRYARADAAMLDFQAAKATAYPPQKANRENTDSARGDPDAGWRNAKAVVDEIYTTPIEHHNPMEPHATIANWEGDRLTVYDATQSVSGCRDALAKTFGMPPEQVAVVCPYVGGGFGSKGSTWSHVPLAAMASRSVGRPVKLALERPQMFGPVGNRPHTEQRLKLGADSAAKMQAMHHGVISETSFIEDWVETSALATRMLYACENQTTTHRLVKMNVATPTFTRAPGEASGVFALESAMDELAYKLGIDPIELRLRNDTAVDPGNGKPFSSKALAACYAQGAERFGWSRRDPRVGAMRDGHWRVGYGVASATYPVNRSPAIAVLKVMADGTALVQSGTQDLGTGTYTVMTQVAADAIGLPVHQVRFELGDSRLPKAPVSGGSQSVASVSPAVQAAGQAARRKLIEMAIADKQSVGYGLRPEGLTIVDGWLRSTTDGAKAEPIGALVMRAGGTPVEARAESKAGPEREIYSMHSFGAVFVEVRVDEDLGIVRVPRIVGTYGVGNLLNAKTAHSQLMGGIVWGVGMSLMEETWRDTRDGRYVNGNLGEYHVPVNADIGLIDIAFVPENDPHVNPLGAKGIGEIGITGVAGAIGNAVYHATGKRIRDLPITLDKLLGAEAA